MADPTLLTFDERIYSIEAVQIAAYRLMNFFTVNITISEGSIQCVIERTADTKDGELQTCIQEFRKEVLDQQLRLKLKQETESVRNLIFGLAFSRTGLQQIGE